MAEPSIDEGGDWDGTDDPAEVAAYRARREAGTLLEELERGMQALHTRRA